MVIVGPGKRKTKAGRGAPAAGFLMRLSIHEHGPVNNEFLAA
jgi:hypothetical protein